MVRDVIGSILFTIAVLAFVNFVGDMAVPKRGAPQPMAVEPAPMPKPAPEPVAKTLPTPTPPPTQVAAANTLTDDTAKGKSIFRKKCMSCHTIDKGGKNRTGPNLWGVVGRPKGSAENFRYSTTMKLFGGVWSEAEISSFIAGPRSFVPDTKMTFAGLKNAKDRADVLAYLKTLAD